MIPKNFQSLKFVLNKSRTIFIPMSQSTSELHDQNPPLLEQNKLKNNKSRSKNKSQSWIKKPFKKENIISSNSKSSLVSCQIQLLPLIMESLHLKPMEEEPLAII